MKLEHLVLNSNSQILLEAYLERPGQSVILTGPYGSGLGTLARTMASHLVDNPVDVSITTPDEKGTISIETTRLLYVATRAKRSSRQVVIIDDIDTMSTEAQNAFLKLLEEPGSSTRFILTTHKPELLLATVLSRAPVITFKPITPEDSQRLLIDLGVTDDKKRQQMLFLGSGRPAELTHLANDDEYFKKQTELIVSAQQLLGGSSIYEKLVLIASYSDRLEALSLVRTTAKIVEFMLGRNHETRLLKSAKTCELVTSRLIANGHVRSQLMYLVTHLV